MPFFIGEFFSCIWEFFVLNILFGILILNKKGNKENVEPIFEKWFLFICSIPILGWLISIFLFLYTYLFYIPVENFDKFSKNLPWRMILNPEEKIFWQKFVIRDILQFIEERKSFALSELYFNFHRFWAGICCFFGSIPVFWILDKYLDLIKLDKSSVIFIIIPSIIYFLSFYFSIEYRIGSNLMIVEQKELDKK